MKTKIIFALFFLLSTTLIVLGQEPDTVVVQEPGGFWGFYSKYSGAIWTILGLLGVTAFLQYRSGKLLDAVAAVVSAAQDGNISEQEFQAITQAFKEVWLKKKELPKVTPTKRY